MTGLAFPKPTPRRAPMNPGQRRRSYIRPKRPRRLDRLTREVLVNDFDGAGPRLETRDGHDQARLDWCRTQPCVVPATVLAGIEIEPGVEYFAPHHRRCWGPIDPCHEGEKRGRNLKSSDALAFSMCRNHHTQWTGGWGGKTGVFKDWTPEQARLWADERGAEAQSLYLSAGSRRGT